MVRDINVGYKSSNPKFLTVCGNLLFFSAQEINRGEELWVSDEMLGSLGEESSVGDNGYGYGGDYNRDSSSVFMTGHHSSSGAGTYRVKDINNGELSSAPNHLVCLSSYSVSQSNDDDTNSSSFGLLLFAADDGEHGYELWRSDGIENHTKMVKDINPGSYGSNPQYLTYFQGKVYFSADDGDHGTELWVSDGTNNGTFMLRDIRKGSSSSFPSFFTSMRPWLNDHFSTSTSIQDNKYTKEKLYFVAIDGEGKQGSSYSENKFNSIHNEHEKFNYQNDNEDNNDNNNNKYDLGGYKGMQLWYTDGTQLGTQRSYDQTMNDMDIDIETLNKDWPKKLTVFEGSLYYPANVGTGASILPKGFHANGNALYNDLNQINHDNDEDDDDGEYLNSLNYDNKDLVTGIDVAFEVYDVDTLSGSGEDSQNMFSEFTSPLNDDDDDSMIENTKSKITQAMNKFENGGYLKLKLSCEKGRLTFGHFLRLENEKNNLGSSTGSQGASRGYRTSSGDIQYDKIHSSSYYDFNELLFIHGDGVNDDMMELIGTSTSINEALKDLRYQAKVNEIGWDMISITLSDTPLQGCYFFSQQQANTMMNEGGVVNNNKINNLSNQSSLMYWIYETWYNELASEQGTPSSNFNNINNNNEDEDDVDFGVFGNNYHMLCDHGESYDVNGKIDIFISSVNDAPKITLDRTLFNQNNKLSNLAKQQSVLDNDSEDDDDDQVWNVYVNTPNTLPLGSIYLSDSDILQTSHSDVFGITSEPLVTVTIRSLNGLLSLSSLEGLTFMDSSQGMNEKLIRFSSSIFDANSAIDGLTYTCDASMNKCTIYSSTSLSSDEITIHIDDNGYSGRGGPLTDSARIRIRILKNSHEDNDDDVTISYDEYYHDYENSEEDYFTFEDDDGSGLSDGEYRHRTLDSIMLEDDDEGNGELESDVYPKGSLSWHDVHLDYGASDEPRQSERIGDADFWDD
jgi:ELWxxDGT repeat protein